VTLVVTGNTISGRIFRRHGVPEFGMALIEVDRRSMGQTVADRSSNEADFLCIFCTLHGGYAKVL
jgi:hypothetical protein